MLKRSNRVLGLAWTLGVLSSAPMAFAQTDRPWVDPPPDWDSRAAADNSGTRSLAVPPDPAATGAVPDRPVAKPASPAANHAATGSDTTRTEEASLPERRTAPERDQRRASARDLSRKTVTERRGTQAMGDQRAKALASKRQTFARGSGRERSPDGGAVLANGLEIMNLRTIELPDGRRIRILTKPDPETVRRVLARPEF
jgi:hypothetical protein